MTRQVRWYFNVNKWLPTKDEWLCLTSCVADEEIARINQFVYQDNAKSALIGRALIRKFVAQAINRPSNEIKFIRTKHGRPAIAEEYKKSFGSRWPQAFDFNVSHSGDFCALVGFSCSDNSSPMQSVGVDVTQIVKKNTQQELDRFLGLMSRREFTKFEWDTVDNPIVESDRQKCINFTRLWCLKESYIKSIGLGLAFKLDRIEFHPSKTTRYSLSPQSIVNKTLNDTRVYLDGQLAANWHFQETALDNDHLVAVGYNLNASDLSACDVIDRGPFYELSIQDLLSSLTSIRDIDESIWQRFIVREARRR